MRIFNAIALAAGLGLGGGAALAQQAALEHITVTGHGAAAAAPDMASLVLGVTTEAKTAAEALRANSAATAGVLDQLTAAGIAARDVQTSGLNLNPRYEESPTRPGGEGQIAGYIAQNQVTVRVRDLPSLGGMLDKVVTGGANTMYGLSFGLADPEPKLDEARKAAVADARRKAELYAAAAGVKLGKVASISEMTNYGGPVPMARASFAKDAVPVAEGELNLEAEVTVVWTIAE